jgi:hypothetical protein
MQEEDLTHHINYKVHVNTSKSQPTAMSSKTMPSESVFLDANKQKRSQRLLNKKQACKDYSINSIPKQDLSKPCQRSTRIFKEKNAASKSNVLSKEPAAATQVAGKYDKKYFK